MTCPTKRRKLSWLWIALWVCGALLFACRRPASTALPALPALPAAPTLFGQPTQRAEQAQQARPTAALPQLSGSDLPAPFTLYLPLVQEGTGRKAERLYLPFLEKTLDQVVAEAGERLQRTFLPLLLKAWGRALALDESDTPPAAETAAPAEPASENPLQFSVEDFETVLPADVTDEVLFASSANMPEPPCYPVNQPVALSGAAARVEWLDSFHWDTCGWQAGELVQVMLTAPDGRQRSEYFLSRQNRQPPGGDIEYIYVVQRDDPAGWYHVVAQGSAGLVETYFYVVHPGAPRMYLLSDGELLLVGFAPREKLRLFYYGASDLMISSFVGYRWLQVSEQGGLEYNPLIKGSFIAVGEQSGEVHTWKVSSEPPRLLPPMHGDITRLDCQARTPYPHAWRLGTLVRNFSGAAPVFYNSPDAQTGAQITTAVRGDAPFWLLSDPVCSGESYWWQVELADGQRAWAQPGDWTSVPEPDAQCSLPEASRLAVGRLARVSLLQGAPVMLRSTPHRSGRTEIETLPVGVSVFVLAGPTCADGLLWWQVRAEDNAAGWLAEGDSLQYFLEPVP